MHSLVVDPGSAGYSSRKPRNRKARLFIVLWAALLVTACAKPSNVARDDSPATRSALPPVSPPPPPPNAAPWRAYLTDVNPGSAIRFTTSETGWRLDGQGGAPYLDDSLAAGPHGTISDWPGSSLSRSVDGGHSWESIYTAKDGIWGLDPLSDREGWVVGVTSLAYTNDGGSTWRELGEPKSKPLVSVDFVSDVEGYGLTTDGQLVQSSDGGASWEPGNLQDPGADLCFASQESGYVSTQDGDVFSTDHAGQTWTPSAKAPIVYDLAPYWSQISCNGSDVWQGLRVLDPGAGGQPYVVSYSEDRGSTWSVVAGNALDESLHAPKAPEVVDQLQQLAVGASGDAFLIGVSESQWELQIRQMLGAQEGSPSTVPSPPSGEDTPSFSNGYLEVHGASFKGSDGWVYLNDNAVGSADSPKTEVVLLGTDDGGHTWRVIQRSSPEPPPPLS